jgi:hypothetical protein
VGLNPLRAMCVFLILARCGLYGGIRMSFAGSRGMRKAKQEMRMTEYKMVTEHENELYWEERTRIIEQGMMTEYGMISYLCNLNK